MTFIGLGTSAQVGKDTIANYLEKKYVGSVKRVGFADKLKEIAMSLFGLSYEQCYGSNAVKETVDPRYGKSSRQIMQELGEKMREIYPNIWIATVFYVTIPKLREQGFITFVISDVRYLNEAEWLQRDGGFLVKVTRPGSGTSVGATHASETQLNDFKNFDYYINNDGSLEELYTKVDALVEVINGRTSGWDNHRR